MKKSLRKVGNLLLLIALLFTISLGVVWLFNDMQPLMEITTSSLWFIGFLSLTIMMIASLTFGNLFGGWLIGIFSYAVLLYLMLGVS